MHVSASYSIVELVNARGLLTGREGGGGGGGGHIDSIKGIELLIFELLSSIEVLAQCRYFSK